MRRMQQMRHKKKHAELERRLKLSEAHAKWIYDQGQQQLEGAERFIDETGRKLHLSEAQVQHVNNEAQAWHNALLKEANDAFDSHSQQMAAGAESCRENAQLKVSSTHGQR